MGLKLESDYNRLYGLFVGIEKFADTSISGLYSSEEDAKELAAVFKDNADVSKRSELNILVNEAATREKILEDLLLYIAAAQAKDMLLFYLSTHGVIAYNDYYFFPHDCKRKNLLGTGISANMITNALHAASSTGVKVLVILDTCHSGAIGFDLSKFKGEFACMLSSSPVEYSYEMFDKERSVFTHYLIEALRNPAPGKNSLISIFEQVYKNVQIETQKKQNPLLIGTMDNKTIILT